VYLYYESEPVGVWWSETRRLVTAVQIQAPRQIFGNPLRHVAHRADVVRLERLIAQGGIYLDSDVLVHKSFDHLLDHSVVIGQEGFEAKFGLANAVILAEPGAPFLTRWLNEYRWFRSNGEDQYWSEHSVQVPLRLAKMYPDEITVLPHTAFYWPLWTEEGLEVIYCSTSPIEQCGTLANHLWESRAWDKYLEHLTPAKVRKVDSNFHRWMRPLITNFADDYGQPQLKERLARISRLQRYRWEFKVRKFSAKITRARQLGIAGTLRRLYARIGASGINLINRLLLRVSKKWHRHRIFHHIYKQRLWGQDQESEFYSGQGSRGAAAQTYVTHLSHLINKMRNDTKRIAVVDLGCGDFEIGKALINRLIPVSYIGCDIVKDLITHLSNHHSGQYVQFTRLDIVSDELPDGDVCVIRQVFQHLSNAEISAVLPKLSKFKKVYVTEGYPVEEVGPANPDIVAGANVRFDWRLGKGRGMELDKEPYNLSIRELFRIDRNKEVLVTFEIDPGRSRSWRAQ
jgi:hypothetical protein